MWDISQFSIFCVIITIYPIKEYYLIMLENYTACFFGHRDSSSELMPILRTEIEKLITQKDVNSFYVGTNGNFDVMVHQVLKEIKEQHPQIEYTVVLAYVNDLYRYNKDDNVLLPEEIDNVPNRFAIPARNNWMIDKSRYVICYINKNYGGAYKSVNRAKSAGKTIINLAEI